MLSNGTSNYTGETYVGAGTLQIAAGTPSTISNLSGGNPTSTSAVSAGPVGKGVLFVSGSAILDLNGNNLAVSGLSSFTAGSGGTIASSSTTGNSTLTIVTSGSNTYFGTIADATSGGTQATLLVIAGSGTQTLSGQSTYSGGTTVYSGTLAIGASSLLSSSGTFTSGPIGTGTLTMNGGTLQLNSVASNSYSVVVLANNIVLNGSITLGSTNTSAPNDLAGIISGPGGITTASGQPYLALSNPSNSFTGGLTITNYSFQISADGALPSGSNLIVGPLNTNTSAKAYFEQSDGVQILSGLSGYGVVTFAGTNVVNNSFTFMVGAGNASSTFNGGIQSGSSAQPALTKIGTGTLILAPPAATPTITPVPPPSTVARWS